MSDVTPRRERVRQMMWRLQDSITAALSAVDGHSFREDPWEHKSGGGGRSRVMVEGGAIEKGGVNVSAVYGPKMPPSIAESVPAAEGQPFFATGVSLVIHPRNPHAPTVHMNCRYFEAGPEVRPDGDPAAEPVAWWFGGGADLTPYYPRREDVVHFHKSMKAACDAYDPTYHARFKPWCDDYFLIKHRKEHRGVGGIFFDYLGQTGKGNAEDNQSFETVQPFVERTGDAFIEAYEPILRRRKDEPQTEDERWFQLYRRGRYVEFNLVYDRGTVFGLQTGGRIESILMSLPPLVRWEYDWTPEPGSREAELYETYLTPRDWAAEAE